MKIHKGDNVVVLSGKDKGRRGEVVRALPKEGRVIVEGVHRVKRHQRTTQVRKRAGIIEKDLAVPVSKVALVCPKEHTPTRAAYRIGDGSKRRICARCGEGL
ncbi:MAG: 50S ribosomal protein L24 [Acidimicrobiales bacterium]|jgi:large subunit ribosomal protein L24